MKLFNYFRVRSIAFALVSSFVLCGALGNDAWAADPLVLYFDDAADGNNFDGYASRGTMWPKTGDTIPSDTYDIPVCWENYHGMLANEKENVRLAIANAWEKESLVRFVGWGQCMNPGRGIRIYIDTSPIIGPYTRGAGTRLNGVTEGIVLNLRPYSTDPIRYGACSARNDDICSGWIAVHEFGHALGFEHEQNRPDRVMGQGGCDPNNSRHNPDQGLYGDIAIGMWDLISIMNYCNPHRYDSGQLSETDIATVKYFYDEVPRYQMFSKTVIIPVVQLGDQKYEVKLRELEPLGRFMIDSIVPTSRLSKTEASFDPATGHFIVPMVFVEATVNPTQVTVYENLILTYDPDTEIVTVILHDML